MRATKGSAWPTLFRCLVVIGLASVLAACGGGGGDGGTPATVTVPVETEPISGKVIGSGVIAGALVCFDANANGRCDSGEAQIQTDATGGYQLAIPRNAAAPLVAEIIAGRAQDADQGGSTVEASYRMASPSNRYSTVITPYTTLVHVTAETNFPLAEDEVRNTLGLPPKFDVKIGSPAAPGSLTQAAGKAVIAALKATGIGFDLSAPGALDQVIAAFPRCADGPAAVADHDQGCRADRLEGSLSRCDLCADQSAAPGSGHDHQWQDSGTRTLDLGPAQEPLQGPVQQRRKLHPDFRRPRHEEAAQLGAARRLLRPLADAQQARLFARQQQRVRRWNEMDAVGPACRGVPQRCLCRRLSADRGHSHRSRPPRHQEDEFVRHRQRSRWRLHRRGGRAARLLQRWRDQPAASHTEGLARLRGHAGRRKHHAKPARLHHEPARQRRTGSVRPEEAWTRSIR